MKDPNSDAGRLAGDDDRIWSAELFPGRQSAFLICFPEEDLSLPGSLYIWTAGTDEVTTGVNLGRHLIPSDKPAKQREPASAVPPLAPAVPASAAPASAAPTAPEEKREPAPAVGSPMWSWNALVLVMAVAIVGVGGFFLVRGGLVRGGLVRGALVRGRLGTPTERPAETRPAGIAMKVQRTGSELAVSWNPQAPNVTQATGGRLVIDEGARNVTLKLSPQQLETGHLLYTTEAEDIRMDMEIAGPSGTYAESVRVAGGLPGLPAEPAIAAAAPPKIPVIIPAVKPLAPEKKPAQNIAAAGVAPPRQQAPRTFVPPPHVTTGGTATGGNPVAARSQAPPPEAPPPDAPQLATPVNALTAGLPELKLPVPRPLQTAVQAKPAQASPVQASPVQASPAQAKVEEYIGPRAIRSVQPAFDASANRTIDNAFSQNHEAHEVQIEVAIDEHGKVTKVSRGATTGPFAYLFVDAALAAARRWQFEPASVGGRPVASKMTLKFAFVRNRKNGGEN